MGNFFTILFTMVSSLFYCQQNTGYDSMNVNEFEALIQKGNIQIVDVRTPNEYSQGHIPQSINIDVLDNGFATKVDSTLIKDKPVAVYCRSGQRSKRAAAILVKKGFTVYELDKGYISWQQANKKITK